MLDSYISKLGNSRPIYKLNLNHNSDRVNSELVESYDPYSDLTHDENDPISRLVADRYTESLSGDRYVTNREHIKRAVCSDIKSELKKFIEYYGGYKNAKQAAVYRFMNQYSTPEPMTDGLVYLYRYYKSIGMAQGRAVGGVEQKHIDNILAIIELMRSKFEQGS